MMAILNNVSIFFKGMLCYYDSHSFIYYDETHKTKVAYKPIKEATIPIRECKRCGKREHHYMAKGNAVFTNWRSFPYGKNAIIKFNKK